MTEEQLLRTPSGVAFSHWPGGEGTPLLVTHGQFGDRSTLRPVYEPFLGARPVVSLDLPWHGRSAMAPREDLTCLADAVLEVLDTLGWPRCRAVGHSWGPHVLFHAGLAAPERFERQLLLGPAGEIEDEHRGMFWSAAEVIEAQGFPDALVDLLGQRWHSPAYLERARDQLAQQIRSNDARAIVAAVRATAAAPALLPRLRGYRVPVTGLVMRDDVVVPAAWSTPFLEAVRAEVRELEGPHFAFLEDPAPFRRELARFLEM